MTVHYVLCTKINAKDTQDLKEGKNLLPSFMFLRFFALFSLNYFLNLFSVQKHKANLH
jgi:hypothetical protein